MLLLAAGSLEGFVSPIESWPLAYKLAVSAGTVALLALYLSLGRQRESAPAATGPGERGELLGLRD